MSLKDKCLVLQFADLGDERGKLVVIEGANSIPFDVKRVFYIYESDSTVVRGQHANRFSEFVLINVAGTSKVRITDGIEEIIVELNKPMMGVYIPKMIWKDMYDFSEDSVLLVLASTHYDGTEYIRDYDEYLSVVKNRPVLSLCMPTNGVPEWVFPSLDSIYSQGVDEKLFEVVVMDNGQNEEFKSAIHEYGEKHQNLKYFHTTKELFLSEPESYKKADGELIKFVNHRNIMEPGSIQYLIDFANQNRDEKPVIYFSNGVTSEKNKVIKYDTFGEFVVALEYFSSWSSGMTIWKEDLDSIPEDEEYNYLFPHTSILFHQRKAKGYIVDGTKMWEEIPQGKKPKGNYNLFYAFAVEYINILLNLLRDGSINESQFLTVKKANLDFLTGLYFDYVIRKKYCSYDLTDYKKSLSVFYSKSQIDRNAVRFTWAKILSKLGIKR